MVVAVVGVGTLVAGAVSASDAGDAADEASANQRKAMDSQAQVAEDQLQFGKDQYSDWKNMFYGPMGDYRAMAYEEQRPNFAQISADVDKTFDTSQDINRRTMERYGVSPTDGAFGASETQYGLGRAMATVNANNTARQQAKDAQFQRLGSFLNLSQGMQTTANNTVNSGSSALGSAFGNQANMYGQQANQYGQAAAAGAQMVGRGLSSLGGWYQANSFGGI